MQVIERFDGRSFPTSAGLARQWLTGRYRRRESSLETVYCAELVATTYQHDGPAAEPPAGELVRPRPLLERRPHRARAAVRALGRDRGRLTAAHAGPAGADRNLMLALRSAPVAIRLALAALTLLLALYAAEIVFAFLPAVVADPFMKYVSNLIFVGAAALCAARGLRGPGERGAWLLMGLGVLAWGARAALLHLLPVGSRDDPGPVAGRRRLPAHLSADLGGARPALPLAHPRPQRSALDRRRHRRARGRRDRRRGRVRRGARVGRGGGPLGSPPT